MRGSALHSARVAVLRMRSNPVAAGLLASYLLLRSWALLRADAITYPDTAGYLAVADGPVLEAIFGADRPPVLPLLYATLDSDGVRIAVQSLISTFSWAILAVVIAGQLRNPVLSTVGMAGVLLLSLAQPVLGWDEVLLTESLALSGAALLIACLVLLVRQPTVRLVVATGAIAALWVGVRDASAPVLVLLALPVAGLLAWHGARRQSAALAGLSVLLFLGSSASVDAGERWQFPQLNVLGTRVLVDDERRAWFGERGLPLTPEVLAMSGKYAGDDDYAFYRIEPLMQWLHDDWRQAYAEYLLTHPGYTIGGVWESRAPLLTPAPWYFSPTNRPGPAGLLDSLTFPHHEAGAVAVGASVLLMAALVALRRGVDVAWFLPALLLATAAPHAVLVHHADAMEVSRHGVLLAVLTRLALLWLALVATDRWLSSPVARIQPMDELGVTRLVAQPYVSRPADGPRAVTSARASRSAHHS